VNPSSPTLEGARGRGVDDPDVKRRGPLNEDLAGEVVAITKEVAEAVLFMLSRPRNVTVRDLVILPQSQDI
jgi:NADP-dependent 3-hydroxy acid dehydrogenase YdfG